VIWLPGIVHYLLNAASLTDMTARAFAIPPHFIGSTPTTFAMLHLPKFHYHPTVSHLPKPPQEVSTRAISKRHNMQRLYDLKSKLNNLTINTTTSLPSSGSDTPMQQNNEDARQSAPRPKYPLRRPSMRLLTETQNINPLPTVKIVTKHSHGFNSERATGLNKLQQLRFVGLLKGMIVGESFHLTHHPRKWGTDGGC
jgi:hypothetical protein